MFFSSLLPFFMSVLHPSYFPPTITPLIDSSNHIWLRSFRHFTSPSLFLLNPLLPLSPPLSISLSLSFDGPMAAFILYSALIEIAVLPRAGVVSAEESLGWFNSSSVTGETEKARLKGWDVLQGHEREPLPCHFSFSPSYISASSSSLVHKRWPRCISVRLGAGCTFLSDVLHLSIAAVTWAGRPRSPAAAAALLGFFFPSP